MHASTGCIRANVASSPPTMIDSDPLTAPISPPLTGASSIVAPLDATTAARRVVAAGEMLLMSMTTALGRSAETTPCGPVRTSSTSGVSGSMVMTIGARRATSAGDPAAVAPDATSSSTGPRLRLCTTSG